MNDKAIQILMVEDSESDIRLATLALKTAKLLNVLEVVKDGESALAYVRRQAPYQDAKRPDLILLDLNLPKLSGHEVLQEIKADPELATIPVVMLTTSEAEADIVQSYKLKSNCYITKPVDLKKFVEIMESLENFWVKIVSLPPTEKAAPEY